MKPVLKLPVDGIMIGIVYFFICLAAFVKFGPLGVLGVMWLSILIVVFVSSLREKPK